MDRAGLAVLGALSRDAGLVLPERHLGLVQAGETADLQARLEHLADIAEGGIDLDRVIAAAGGAVPPGGGYRPMAPPGQRIAIAQDEAFSFVYPHMAAGWREAGAELVPFSPLADEPPPDDCDCCWLPGGYPELHAGRIAAARRFLDGTRAFAASRPVHGECGGYMVLGEVLEDAEGVSNPMLNLLPVATSYRRRKLHLGYRVARLSADGALGRVGSTLIGHEFHYASVTSPDPTEDNSLARIADAEGADLGFTGHRCGHVTGSFFHLIAAGD